MCISTTNALARAATAGLRGSPDSAVMSLTMRAPAASAPSMTSAWRVSIETAAPASASSRTTFSTRRSSSCGETGLAPGRVDSPPTSMMSAPAPSSARPCWTARAGSMNAPPSEKLSGVTFNIPMITGRSSANPAQCGRLSDSAVNSRAMRVLTGVLCFSAQARSRGRGATAAATPPRRRASNSAAAKALVPPASGSASSRSTAIAATLPTSSPSGRSQSCALEVSSSIRDSRSVAIGMFCGMAARGLRCLP